MLYYSVVIVLHVLTGSFAAAAANDFTNLLSCLQKEPFNSDLNATNSSHDCHAAKDIQSSPVKPPPSLNEAAQALSKLAISTACPAPYTALKIEDKLVQSSVEPSSTERKTASKQLMPSVATIFSATSNSDSMPNQKSVNKLNDDTLKQQPPGFIQENPRPPVMFHRPPLLPQPVRQGNQPYTLTYNFFMLL